MHSATQLNQIITTIGLLLHTFVEKLQARWLKRQRYGTKLLSFDKMNPYKHKSKYILKYKHTNELKF